MAKRVKIPGRLESAETGNIVTGADAVMDDAKGKTQVVINSEVDAAIINLAQGKQDNLTFDSAPTEDSSNPVTSAGVYTADKVLSDAIEAILLLIPSAASALNKLVDMQTMNSSIATATASFKGTYNLVSDLHLGVDATHEQIGAALDALSLDADNNDYAFVQVPNSATAPTEVSKTERYKFNGANWLFEYDLNNSGFTQGQWNAINSGVTSLLVGKLSDLPTNAELTTMLAGKQDNLTFDNVPTAGSPNPVKSGGVYARNNEIVALINALDAAKQDVLTFDNAPVDGSPNPVKSGGVYMAISAVQAAIVALDAEKQNVLTFDSTPTLGSANPVTSSGIKTQLNRIDGNITTLNDLYEALTQSALVIVQPTDTWPVASPATKTIYRVVDRVNTPPQNYSDYMWNGTAMVLMATYDNAIDDEPVAGSNNLVKSGGVFNAISNKVGYFEYDKNILTQSGFLDASDGSIQQGPYVHSENIVVNEGDVIQFYGNGGSTVAVLAAFNGETFDASKSIVGAWPTVEFTYIVPSGIDSVIISSGTSSLSSFYLRITKKDSVMDTIEILNHVDSIPVENSMNLVRSGGVYGDFSDFSYKGFLKEDAERYPESSITRYAYLSDQGTVVSNQAYFYTDFIPIEGSGFYVELDKNLAFGGGSICYYNESKQLVFADQGSSGVSAEPITDLLYHIVRRAGDLTKYVRLSVSVLVNMPSFGSFYIYNKIDKWIIQPDILDPVKDVKSTYFINNVQCTDNSYVRVGGMNYIKNNIKLSAMFLFSTFGTNVVIRKGSTQMYYNDAITITSTTIVHQRSQQIINHGLSIQNWLRVEIDVDFKSVCTIKLTTDGGEATFTLNNSLRGDGEMYVSAFNGCNINNASIQFKSLNEVLPRVYGDSYTSADEASATRWPRQAFMGGCEFFLNGLTGGTSGDLLPVLIRDFNMCPKASMVIWGLGMNDGGDPDNTTPAVAWLSGVKNLQRICERYNVRLVLCTIPSTPSHNNEGKNYYVRNSGYKYIDFAAAVTENVPNWYPGMLNQDGVHPTEEGAIALYLRAISDCPELANSY